jgi:hypothetical protein
MVEQLLNMDETSNSVRQNKVRPRRVVCSKLSTIEPHCRDATDVTHVSLVAIVSLKGQMLKSFLVTISRVGFRDRELALMREQFQIFETNKSYMTTLAMAAYVREVIEPYVLMLRRERADPTLPHLPPDG